MSGGYACECKPQDRKHWFVMDRNCNYSAFNGHRRTYSAYSALKCCQCGRVWRTKAAYVRLLPDMLRTPVAQAAIPPEQTQQWPGVTITGGQS